jgi:cytochrome c oxidase subunit 1
MSGRWTDHRVVGLGYLAISGVAVLVGTLLSLAMRLHLTWPDWPLPLHGAVLPEEYLALVTMHGTLMLFFVLTVAPQAGFGNLILPAQIGAEGMAFPRLNAAGMWLTAVALIVLVSAVFVPGGGPIGGWTAYPPLSTTPLAGPGQGAGMDCWLASIALFAVASTLSAVNTLTTVVQLRCEGMTWERLPLTVLGWFTAALLSVLAFSVLLAALALLFCDRHLGSGFFLPAQELVNGVLLQHRGDGSPLLWLHLFWFFGHPEVYIAVLPGMGLTSMVLANFARRRVVGYRMMIWTTLAIGLLGILVWGHHMFVAGLNPFAGTAFSVSTIAIAVPASAKVLSWLGTVWGSGRRGEMWFPTHRAKGRAMNGAPGGLASFTTAMLFALGFVSLFVTGGLSGPILAQPILDEYLHNTFFVVAHFHLIMAMAGVFGLYCAMYYWAPLVLGRRMGEGLGQAHFWLTLVLAYATFLPMHVTGLAGEPRHYAQLDGMAGPTAALLQGTMGLQRWITVAAMGLAGSQVLFLVNLVLTLRRARETEANPWGATTLEWAPVRETVAVYREPCQYSSNGEVFLTQWDEAASHRAEPE